LVGGALQIWGAEVQRLIEDYFNIASIAFVVLLVGGFVLIRWSARRVARGNTEEIPSQSQETS
jgi:hypothetical protein